MTILGIDPGLALTGWSIVEKKDKPQLLDYGCIVTHKDQPQTKRLLEIYRKLQKIIQKYKPQILCIEKLFFNKNVKTALMVGETRGIIKICGLLNKLKISEFTPLQIKEAITGFGRADKKQIQLMVKSLLGLEAIPRPDDAADAVAVALTYCAYKRKFEK